MHKAMAVFNQLRSKEPARAPWQAPLRSKDKKKRNYAHLLDASDEYHLTHECYTIFRKDVQA
jgi:hypothetical protein